MRVVALLVVTLAAACRPDDPDLLVRDDFAGIRGRLYLVADPCCGSYPSGDCPAAVPTDGIVRAIAVDGTVAEVAATAGSEFVLPLAPGSYAIDLAPSSAYVDRSVGPLVIDVVDGGWRIERTYQMAFVRSEIMLSFVSGTTRSAVVELLAAEGLNAYYISADDPIWIAAALPAGLHPQLEGERLIAAYPGVIVAAEANAYGCLAGG